MEDGNLRAEKKQNLIFFPCNLDTCVADSVEFNFGSASRGIPAALLVVNVKAPAVAYKDTLGEEVVGSDVNEILT